MLHFIFDDGNTGLSETIAFVLCSYNLHKSFDPQDVKYVRLYEIEIIE